MNFSDYQAATAETAIYPTSTPIEALTYVTLGLVGEAGELANKVKKILRDGGGVVTLAIKQQLMHELGDVLWYASQLATEIDYDLGEVAQVNLNKLAARKAAGTLQGSGDNR